MNMSPEEIAEEDAWLRKLFADVGIILSKSPEEAIAGWHNSSDYHVMREFLVKDIARIQQQLDAADDTTLYDICQHTYNLLDWIDLIATTGFPPTFKDIWGEVFEEAFGDKNILETIYSDTFRRWLDGKSGQLQVGNNVYSLLEDTLYYRDRFGHWYAVEKATAFDLKPTKTLIDPGEITDQLDSTYKTTWYEDIINTWDAADYEGTLTSTFFTFEEAETSPEAYFDFSLTQIKTLLNNPVSRKELERWYGAPIEDLEHIIKLCAKAIPIVKQRRNQDDHSVYFLRDCLMFYELHKALDILESRNSSCDQVLIGRKLLSHPLRDWGYYAIVMEVLYQAHRRYPDNFNDFYNEFSRLLSMFVALDPDFAHVVDSIKKYVAEHITTDKTKVTLFDIGFQGSIPLLVKYIIDHHINPTQPENEVETDISIFVGAEWSRQMFAERYLDDDFSFLNHFQRAARSDELYHYKKNSLKDGAVRVEMGDKTFQKKAAAELVVLLMVTLLTHQNT